MAISIGCNDPPDGDLGDAYSHPLTVSAPTGSTVSITGGALPPGLTINTAGVISGTPTLGGSYGFVATVTPLALLRSPRSFTPVTIGTSIQGYDISDNVCGGYAFTHSGAQYAFLRGGGLSTPEGDQKIHAFKSADSGATWTELNAGAAIPHAAVAGFGSAYAVGVDGNTAYVITARVTHNDFGPENTFNGIGVTTFNLTAGVWGVTTNYSTPQVTVWHESPPGAPPGTTGPRRPGVQMVVLGPGNYLLFYGGPFEVLSGWSYGRVYCATFNGSTFGAEVMLPGQAGNLHSYTAVGAVAGSDGTAQLLFQDGNNDTLYSVGRQSSGTLGTPQAITNDTYFHNVVCFSPPCLYQVAAVESIGVLAWINGPTQAELHVFHAPMVLNPAWQDSFTCAVVDDVTSGSPPTSPTYAVVLANFVNAAKGFSLSASTDTIWAMWTTTALSGGGTVSRIWYCQANTATLTWTAPAILVESAYQGAAPFLKPVASQVVSWYGDGLGVIVLTQDYNSLSEVAESIVVGSGGGGGTASVACVVTVGYGDLSTSCGVPPAMQVGQGATYRPPVTLGSIGLPPVYDLNDTLVWTFPVGVPAGFHWETAPASPNYGYLTGTPTTAGTFSFTYTVSTPDGQSVTNTCPLNVEPADDGGGGGGGGGSGSINITCGNPPGGKVGVPYSHTFPVAGATGPTIYSVVVGALPPGVHLDPVTGDLSGIPTAPGTYSFSVKVQQ